LDEIANSIASLAELFKDLSVLVIDQGTLLDSVEYNIEQTAVRVGDAVKELQEATRWVTSCFLSFFVMYVAFRYQKNTGRRKCIFLLLLVILGLILVLIFKPRRHASSPPPPLPVPTDPGTGPDSGTRLRLRSTGGRSLPLPYPPSRPLDLSSNSVFDVWELGDGTAGYSILSAKTRT
jgi:syntaxin 16